MACAAIFLNFHRIKLMHRLILGFSPAPADIIFCIKHLYLSIFLYFYSPLLSWMECRQVIKKVSVNLLITFRQVCFAGEEKV